MLAHLRVRDLVLIDELDLALSSKLNVLTGETGAGKSLVATALDLLLGRRASGQLVRRGSKEAEVEGLFDISDEPEVSERLVDGVGHALPGVGKGAVEVEDGEIEASVGHDPLAL